MVYFAFNVFIGRHEILTTWGKICQITIVVAAFWIPLNIKKIKIFKLKIIKKTFMIIFKCFILFDCMASFIGQDK